MFTERVCFANGMWCCLCQNIDVTKTQGLVVFSKSTRVFSEGMRVFTREKRVSNVGILYIRCMRRVT